MRRLLPLAIIGTAIGLGTAGLLLVAAGAGDPLGLVGGALCLVAIPVLDYGAAFAKSLARNESPQ